MILCAACNAPLEPHAPQLVCCACGAEHAIEPDIFRFTSASERRPDVGYRDSFFDTNAQCETRHFWFLGRNAVVRRLVLTHLARNSRFLEIGCGTGNMMRVLGALGYGVEGTDVSVEALRIAKAHHAARYYEADINRLPFIEHYPAAGLFDVLEHMNDDAHALAMIRQALEPGGLLFLTVPAGAHLYSSYDELLCHKRRYDLAPLLALLSSAGFSIIKASHFFFFLYPLMAMARRTRHSKGIPMAGNASEQLRRELKIYPGVNGLFRAVMACEAQLLRFTNFPAGGSIAVVARKT